MPAVLSYEEYRALTEEAPILIWRSDLTKACDYFNDRWLAFTGRGMDQEIGYGWAQGVHPDDLERCVATYTTSFDDRRPFEMEYRLRRYDGQYRWVFDRGVPFTTPDGAFAGYIGSCIDVTDAVEGRAAQRRLAEAELLTLRGPLPVCAACKRIRDDEGTWHTLETFLVGHTAAQPTHGLCPPCLDSALAGRRANDPSSDVQSVRR